MDIDRLWFKSRVGLSSQEIHRDLAFCSYTIAQQGNLPFIVRDTLKDPRFHTNPVVVGHPNIRFYAGFPLVVNVLYHGSETS